jgi:tRNA 2-selenouridine synthase
MIGARSIPTIVKQQMDSAQLILIEENIDFRIEQIYRDYVVNLYQEFVEVYAQDGLNQYHQFLNLGVQKIAKRLGGTNSQTVKALIDKAIDQQQRKGHFEGHQDWIRFLLESYYDPMYAYQIDNKSARVSVRGDSQLIADYLSQYLT